MRRTPLLALGSLAVAALAAAGCGGTSNSGQSASNAAAMPGSSNSAAEISTAKTSLGTVVVDGSGRTLYLFAKDIGPKSTCSGACATDWPPVAASSTPATAGGIPASALSLIHRSDGRQQVALDGHPLYAYAGDQAAGQVNGQGLDAFGAKWFTLSPAGKRITAAAPSGGASTTRGAYGY